MNFSRIMGNNIALELKKHSMTAEQLAEAVGYSQRDVNKLLEGRLFIPPFQVNRIAEALQVSNEDLMNAREAEECDELVHNFRKFKNPANRELVLDLIDMYADLEEALAGE